MLERIKMAWHALTKKEYAFFAVERHVPGDSGAVCIISKDASKVFLEAAAEYLGNEINKIGKE